MRGQSPDSHLARCASVPRWDLLHRPAVAVRVAEEDEPSPREVLDVADLHPAAGELRSRGLNVVDDELQALRGARRRVDEALPDRDRAGRAGRRQLDEPDLVADAVV